MHWISRFLTRTDAGEVELATRVMQVSTDYKVGLHNKAAGLPEEDARECYCLEVEYLIMRTSLVSNGMSPRVAI
jgi:hypothetical protein